MKASIVIASTCRLGCFLCRFWQKAALIVFMVG